MPKRRNARSIRQTRSAPPTGSKRPQWLWIVLSSVVTFCLGGVFGPSLAPVAYYLRDSIYGPQLELKPVSLLILKSESGQVASVRFHFRLTNYSVEEQTVSPIYLRRPFNRDSILFVNPQPIRLQRRDSRTDSTVIPSFTADRILSEWPDTLSQAWVVGVRLAGRARPIEYAFETKDLCRLNFMLLPRDSFPFPKSVYDQVLECRQVVVYHDKKTGKKGRLDVKFSLYPKNQFTVITDSLRGVGERHVIDGADIGSQDTTSGVPGVLTNIAWVYSLFRQSSGGYVFVSPSDFPLTEHLHWWDSLPISKSVEGLYSIFGTTVDPAIRSGDQFIYLEFR